ncbi:MAG: hypothetical protein HGA47_09025, partial [Zoogloea sp.]|nr:hypothetical protein [Zoogloea sp.]
MFNHRSALIALALCLPCAAFAQQGGACREDVRKYCSGAARTPEGVKDCLLDHQKEVSDACYDTMKARMEGQRGLQACKPCCAPPSQLGLFGGVLLAANL